MDQSDILQNIQMAQIFLNYIMTEGEKVNLALGQNHKTIVWHIAYEWELLLVLQPDKHRKLSFYQLKSHMPCTENHVNFL